MDPAFSPLNRDDLVEVLHAENVLARKYFWPGCHRMEPYRSLFPNASLLLPNTEAKSAQVIVLPTGQCVSRQEIVAVCSVIKAALGRAQEVRRALQRKDAASSVNEPAGGSSKFQTTSSPRPSPPVEERE